jgi:hypothetical protein
MTMAYFKVQIETGNAAFDDNEHYEIGRILIQLGKKMQREEFYEHCKLFDDNGNKVGFAELRKSD